MTIGDRIRILPEKEFRIMSPPRKPRGEKPTTTIRYLKRQIANLQASCAMYHRSIEDKTKVIAGYDVQLDEANDEAATLRRRVADQAGRIGHLAERLRLKSERLAFLEGYYAKSQETVSALRPIRPAGSLVAGDPAETQTGGRPRDQEGLPPRRQGG